MAYEDDLRRVREAKARFGKELLANPDVHGVGIGYRRRDGERTDELAIVVHVQRKLGRDRVAPQRFVPASVRFVDRHGEDVEVGVDVVERPIPVPEVSCGDCGADLERRVRPVLGGYSGGPPTSVSTGGTLGGWVWDTVTDQAVVISNDHVFGGTAGTDISQPSTFDGGALPADRIADVLRSGSLDVSIAAPTDPEIAEYAIECGGPGVYEITAATVGMVVQKTGQTTGLTCGVVELIDYDSDHYGSQNDLWIDGDGADFSMGGDSGSLYLEATHPEGASWRRVVGIHWGGSGDDGVGHPIQAVFDDLELTTICTGVIGQFVRSMFARSEEAAFAPDVRHLELVERGGGVGLLVRRPVRNRRRSSGFARAVESRLGDLKHGRDVVELVKQHRVTVVKVLRHADGRRAAARLLSSLGDCVTTDDVLAHTITADDLAHVERLAKVVQRVGDDDASALVALARRLAADAEGATLRQLLG